MGIKTDPKIYDELRWDGKLPSGDLVSGSFEERISNIKLLSKLMSKYIAWGFSIRKIETANVRIEDLRDSVRRDPGVRIEMARVPNIEIDVLVGAGEILSHWVHFDVNIPEDVIVEKVYPY